MSEHKLNSKLEELRALILAEDRAESTVQNQILLEKIQQIEREINDPEKFARLIRQSKSEVIDVLGPTMGKLLKRFIRSEIERLNKNIQQKSRSFFSSFLGRKRRSPLVETDVNLFIKNRLIQFFVIEKESGLILAEHASEEVLDSDLLAGMLTAIKSFVEGAIENSDGELESMNYSDYTIQLFEMGKYYFAGVFSASLLPNMKSELYDDFLDLAEQNDYRSAAGGVDEVDKIVNSKKLYSWFQEKYKL